MERKKISQKIEEQPVMKVLFITFFLLIIFFMIYVKILGSTNIGHLVEKDGYCKLKYGEEWNFNEKQIYCYKFLDNKDKLKPIEFSEEEFRDFCPQNRFFSNQFYSDCFYNGDSR